MNPGIDIVGIERFRRLIERKPNFLARFFTPAELEYGSRAPEPVTRLAGTFAAKEAVMKALGLTPAPAWSRRIEILRDASGAPHARVGSRRVAVSISHDGGLAVALALPPTSPEPSVDDDFAGLTATD